MPQCGSKLGWDTSATGATSAATGVCRTAFHSPHHIGLPLVGADESAPHTLMLLVRVLNRTMSDGADPSNVIAWTTFRVGNIGHRPYGGIVEARTN